MKAKLHGQWRHALGRGAEWRYLGLFVVLMLIPAASAMAPIHGFLRALFDYSPRSQELVRSLDSAAFTEVVRQIGEPGGEGMGGAMFGVVLSTALVAPLLAGAALALARRSAPVNLRSLLGDAAELYPRMVRVAVASCIPLGVAAAGAGAAFHIAGDYSGRAVLESSASHASELATLASVVLFWLANATVEAGRAHFAVEPDQRSALGAWWRGVKLTVRYPRQVLGLCFVTAIVGVGVAAVVTAIRMRITQAGTGSILVALVLGQVAVAALAWEGRASWWGWRR